MKPHMKRGPTKSRAGTDAGWILCRTSRYGGRCCLGRQWNDS